VTAHTTKQVGAGITVYGGGAAEFKAGNVSVLVRSDNGNERAAEYAAQLADHATAIAAAELRVAAYRSENVSLSRTIGGLEAECATLRAKVRELKGETPTTLMGPGTVRFTRGGDLWILNKRETGWASFGFRLDGWDELFRRFKVVVTEHGVDEHGAYWIVSNARPH
jgi:hypothetical protein